MKIFSRHHLRYAPVLILLLLVSACSTPINQKTETEITTQPIVQKTDISIIGEIEPVTILAAKSTFAARIDTGATTSSIDAQDIVRFERDGKSWVKFNLKDRKTGKVTLIESKLTRIVEIKRHGAEPQLRPAVKLKTKLGDKELNAEFTLADRSSFDFPVLIGRNVLSGNFIVDVSLKNSTSLMAKE